MWLRQESSPILQRQVSGTKFRQQVERKEQQVWAKAMVCSV